MRWWRGLAASLVMLATPLASATEPITASNWQRHPAIVEIRAIYRKTQEAEAAGRLRVERRAFEQCRAYEDGERILYVDADGGVRSYHVGKGSEDSAVQAAFHYDRSGILRFVFVRAGAVNGTTLEYRVYLSKAGERLWEDRKDLTGPGYTFPSRLPDDWLVGDPKQAFHAANPCPEAR